MRRLVASCAALAACSTQVPTYPATPTIACEADVCPSDAELVYALQVQSDVSPELDPLPPLLVTWATPEALAPVVSFTVDEHNVTVASMKGLFHERWHVRFFETGDHGDGNHEAPPGPWTSETNAAIERTEEVYFSEGE